MNGLFMWLLFYTLSEYKTLRIMWVEDFFIFLILFLRLGVLFGHLIRNVQID